MAYQALYRKWRPMVFSDVVGQQHIVDTIKNELISGKIAHAYLFCGTRGTGKTSMAKILSRAINCLNPLPNGDPCNECEICRGLLDGSIMDVNEIDAASNNGVENIRNIRNEVIYEPASARYRVYIIDEVHMLSTSAFNALLKTLEEPPGHVVFIPATTEAHKIPATVQSRCQRFDFRRISAGAIFERLSEISEKDGINITHEALKKIAHLAAGSMRDALSILDQCAAMDEITLTDVEDLVGIAGDGMLSSIADCIADEDAGGALVIADRLISRGKDVNSLADSILNYIRDIMICKTVDDASGVVAGSAEQLNVLKSKAERFTYEELIYMIRQLSDVITNARLASNPRVLLEAGLIKLCKPELSDSEDAILARIAKLEKTGVKRVIAEQTNAHEEPVENSDKPDNGGAPDTAEPMENPPFSVENPGLPVEKSQNAQETVEKIRQNVPRARMHLMNTKARMEDGVLVIVQPNKIIFDNLSKQEFVQQMELVAGCRIVVMNEDKPLDKSRKKSSGAFDELLAQKDIFGDKMTIIDE